MSETNSVQSPPVSVIVVNYNGKDYIDDCLRALDSQTFRGFEVIVVDNGSTDGSTALIRERFPWVRLIPLSRNEGFARGNNIGIAASRSTYVVTLNNDAIPETGWLEALCRASSDSAVGMAASKILLGMEGREIDSVGMLAYEDGMTRQRGRGESDVGQYDGLREVLFPSACAALYRRSMLDEIGGFDEDFFSYCEDADLGLRGRLAGWQAVFAPDAVVRHLYSRTGGTYSAMKAYHVERNRLWVLLKDFPVSYIILSPPYTLWRYLVQAYGLLSGKGSSARFAEKSGTAMIPVVLMRAWRDSIAAFFRIIIKRRGVWRLRRITLRDYRQLLKKNHIGAASLGLRD